jgi:hypothetical protein
MKSKEKANKEKQTENNNKKQAHPSGDTVASFLSDKANAPVQAHALIGNNLHNTTTTEGLGVCLSLDLKDVKGQEGNLSDSDKRTSGGVHDGLASLLAKDSVELGLVVAVQELVNEGLTTKLVDALGDLVTGSETETGEEGGILLEEGGVSGVLEDDLVGVGDTDSHSLTRNEELIGMKSQVDGNRKELVHCYKETDLL